jgi:hypothetical protein
VRLNVYQFPHRMVALINRLPTRKFHSGLALTRAIVAARRPSIQLDWLSAGVDGIISSALWSSSTPPATMSALLLRGLHHQEVASPLIVESGVQTPTSRLAKGPVLCLDVGAV